MIRQYDMKMPKDKGKLSKVSEATYFGYLTSREKDEKYFKYKLDYWKSGRT